MNVVWAECTIVFVNCFLVEWHLDRFQFGTVADRAAVSISKGVFV